METPSVVLNPIVQWGFAGLCAILLGIVVWLIRNLMDLLARTNDIIGRNTDAIRSVGELTKDELKLTRDAYEKLISRPCMREREP